MVNSSHLSTEKFMTRYKNIVWTGLLAGALVTLAHAASADPPRSYRQSLQNEIQQDRRELRDSRQELKSDLKALKEDRRGVRKDRRSGGGAEETAPEKRGNT